MATYAVGTQKNPSQKDVSFEHQKYNGFVGQHFFKTLRSGQVSLIYFAQAVRIIYAEDRSQLNRELNYLFFGKWKIGFLVRQSDTAARCGCCFS